MKVKGESRNSTFCLVDYLGSVLFQVSFMELLEERDGRPKGCAIVEFKTRDDAEKCVKSLHRYEFNGRALGVKEIRVSLTHTPSSCWEHKQINENRPFFLQDLFFSYCLA